MYPAPGLRAAPAGPLSRLHATSVPRPRSFPTSGMADPAAIMFCRDVLGPDHVLYAMDYPYEYSPDEVRIQDGLPLTLSEKKEFFQGIAETVFGL
jgi:predicted TIM-barrel fold metal-dependent hydrolase